MELIDRLKNLTEPTLFAFLVQMLGWASYIPLSYVAYKWVRAPLKRDRVKLDLLRLGITQTKEFEKAVTVEYHLKHYVWPLLIAFLLLCITYSAVHPYFIRRDLWVGLLEDVIDVFGVNDPTLMTIPIGRYLFWGWLGAYIYSVHLTFRRFLAYDLTPSVYIFTANRFWLALVVGSMVGVGMGAFLTAARISFDITLTTVSLVIFFVGFFPEQGINWVVATAQKALKQQGGISKEIALSEIEGLSIWYQGRLKQEGIENVQNLATANVPALVVSTPFTLNQIIDWVDQAILLRHTSKAQFEALEKAGIICASDTLANIDDENLNELVEATGLGKSELKVLIRGLQSALNIELVIRFRWQSSLDKSKVEKAKHITLSQVQPVVLN